MQNQPFRPLMFPSGHDFLNLGDAARVSAVLSGLPNSLNNLSTSNPPSSYPEIALISQFSHIFPQQLGNEGGPNGLAGNEEGMLSEERAPSSRAKGPSRSGDSRGSGAYASRHQAAEQRRRTRINDRLDLLRKLVPHAERANTACFLEEVIKYIDSLKRRVGELESLLAGKGMMNMPGRLPGSESGGPSRSQGTSSMPPPSPPPNVQGQVQTQLNVGGQAGDNHHQQQLLQSMAQLDPSSALLKQYQDIVKGDNSGQLVLGSLSSNQGQVTPSLGMGLTLQQLQLHAQSQLQGPNKSAQLSDLANQLGRNPYNLFQSTPKVPSPSAANGKTSPGPFVGNKELQGLTPEASLQAQALLRLRAQAGSTPSEVGAAGGAETGLNPAAPAPEGAAGLDGAVGDAGLATPLGLSSQVVDEVGSAAASVPPMCSEGTEAGASKQQVSPGPTPGDEEGEMPQNKRRKGLVL